MDKIVEIEINLINDNPYQTRTNFDHVEQLAENIKINGLDNPIKVRLVDGKYYHIAGDTRLRAVKLLGWDKIPCIVKDLTDFQAQIESYTDNKLRWELNPIADSRAIYAIFEKTDKVKSSDNSIAGDTVKTLSENCIEPIQNIIVELTKLHHKTSNDTDLKHLCDTIGLSPLSIINSLNLLNLPPALLTDDYHQSKEGLNGVVRCLKSIDDRYLKAKLLEDEQGDTNHIESNKLKNYREKIEKRLIKKIKSDKFEDGTLIKVTEAIIKAPTDLIPKVLESSKQEVNRNIAVIILKVDSYDNDVNGKRFTDKDKFILMEDMVKYFATYKPEKLDGFINQYVLLSDELKRAVKDHLNIEAAILIWGIEDREKRKDLIEEVIKLEPRKQIFHVNKFISKEKELERLRIEKERADIKAKMEEDRIKKEREKEDEERAALIEEVRLLAEKQDEIDRLAAIEREKERIIFEEENRKFVEIKEEERRLRDIELEEKERIIEIERRKEEDERLRLEKIEEEEKRIKEEENKKLEQINKKIYAINELERLRLEKIEEDKRREIEDNKRKEEAERRANEEYKEIIIENKEKLIKNFRAITKTNVDTLEHYPQEYKDEIKKAMNEAIVTLTEKMKLIE